MALGAAAFFSVVFFSAAFFSVLGSAFSFLGAAAGLASFTVPEAPAGSVRVVSEQYLVVQARGGRRVAVHVGFMNGGAKRTLGARELALLLTSCDSTVDVRLEHGLGKV